MTKENINKTVKDGLCMGCGVCEDICPKHCITIKKGRLNRPIANNTSCVDCGLCRKVCAGTGIDIEMRAKNLFGEDALCHQMLGHYRGLYKGYSSEYEIRYHCASGGCLSQFLIWLLEKGEIDGAVVTGYEQENPMEPRVYIARNREDVLNGKSSKYCVVTMNGVITEMKCNLGRYVVVGLPCHIHAFRKYCGVDKKLSEQIIGFFAIFCSGNKNKDSQRFLLWRYGIEKERVKSFAYRDNGCLGSMFFRDSEGNTIGKPIKYLDYYSGMRSFFSVPRCYVCSDFFGELADIGFGDLNDGSAKDDPVGINSLITRSIKWQYLLIQCANEGVLELSGINEEQMVYANRFCLSKKGNIQYAARNIRKWSGRKNPSFDNIIGTKPVLNSYVAYCVASIMRVVGRHSVLWPIIKKLDRSKFN